MNFKNKDKFAKFVNGPRIKTHASEKVFFLVLNQKILVFSPFGWKEMTVIHIENSTKAYAEAGNLFVELKFNVKRKIWHSEPYLAVGHKINDQFHVGRKEDCQDKNCLGKEIDDDNAYFS
jgi:hypothetical protein